MTRGKHAAIAARRDEKAARAALDVAMEKLAEEKVRRRANDVAARDIGMLRRRVAELEAQIRDDKLLADAHDAIHRWRAVAAEDHERRRAAITEIAYKLRADLRMQTIATQLEFVETVYKRYPALMAALTAGRSTSDSERLQRGEHLTLHRTSWAKHERKLSDADLLRFQRLTGQRHSTAEGQSLDFADILEASQAGFTKDDVLAIATI